MKNHEFIKRKEYIKELSKMLKVMPDFKDAVYIATRTGQEYIRVRDTLGGAEYLEVSQMELCMIFVTVALLVMGKTPKNKLDADRFEDLTIIRRLVPYFNVTDNDK